MGKKTKRRVNRNDLNTAVKIKRAAAARVVISKIIENPSMAVGAAMRDAGLSEYAATHPSSLTKTTEWNQLLDEYLPEGDLLETHKSLLRASHLDHMTFPLETPSLTDAHITEMLTDLNCTVRRISHGEQARHVYFFAPDNRARKDALDMGYKLRGTYAAEKHLHVGLSLADLASSRDIGALPPVDDTAPELLGASEE